MTDQIPISKTLKIRDCGYDENWLQEQIAARPAILGLGDLVFVEREKRQVSGGRLDILLKTHDGDAVFEVEVMLGETDGSHIIRTIEYWDLEQSQDPKRKHFPVLVAEDVTRRFFNVIYRFSHSIPIIAIKANIVDLEGRKALHFTTILNAYEESAFEERASGEIVDEKYWQEKASSTLAHAKKLQELFSRVLGEMKLGFTKIYIRLRHDGEIYFSLSRSSGKSTFKTWLKGAEIPAAKAALDNGHITYDVKPYPDAPEWQSIGWKVDQNSIQENASLFQEIAKLVERSWQSTPKAKAEYVSLEGRSAYIRKLKADGLKWDAAWEKIKDKFPGSSISKCTKVWEKVS